MYGYGTMWKTSKVKRLKQLVSEGHSSSYISDQLGTSRDSVISKCNRLGLRLALSSDKTSSYQKSLKTRVAVSCAGRKTKISLPKLSFLEGSID